MEKIYEGSAVVVKAAMPPEQAKQLKSLTIKFLADGEPAQADELSEGDAFEKAHTSIGADGTLEHRVHAPKVPGDKDTYVLTYHIFYEVENAAGKTVKNQELSVRQYQVFPRAARLKAVWAEGPDAGKPFPDFHFKVFQGGAQVGDVRHTLTHDTQDVHGKTIPAGTAEFNLEKIPGFAIVQENPWEIAGQKADAKDKRSVEAKGDLKFRAAFVNPAGGRIRQYVNLPEVDAGRAGAGPDVVVDMGVAGGGRAAPGQAIHFRATFGPEAGGTLAKSKRKDADFPTQAEKADPADKGDIREKQAGEKYEGKLDLSDGRARLKLRLGRAGGDTCKLEIAGSDKFLTDKSVLPDQVLEFENWRRVHYELMVPSTVYREALDPETLDLRSDMIQRLESVGRQVFVEFVHDETHLFDAMGRADHGAIGTKRFFGLGGSDQPAYVLSGRNWRQPPQGEAWAASSPARTLYISLCDLLLKWKKDTADEGAGPKDFSGTLTSATGMIDVRERFQGLFMPFSGFDGRDGVADVTWTADISKDDPACKIKPELKIEEDRYDYYEADEAVVEVSCGVALGSPLSVSFARDAKGVFPGKLDSGQAAAIDAFVAALLKDRDGLAETGGKVTAHISLGKLGGKGEDDCFAAVKDAVQKAFDKHRKEITAHPGLGADGRPRTGVCRLIDITDMGLSTLEEWHFALPAVARDGSPGPGAFVGPGKTKDRCPVKFSFSFQPHESSPGEAEAKLMAWACSAAGSENHLLRLVVRTFGSDADKGAPAHGHGDEGKAGDCLERAEALCDKCREYGRASALAAVG
jgi:hypothetical protein